MKLLKELSYRFFHSRLVIGSFVMAVGTLVGGLGNYLYHFLMGRMLGPADYGILVTLISLSYLLSIPVSTLSLVIVKFVSAFKGKKDMVSISTLFKIGNKKILPFSFLILLIFLILVPLVTSFLHLPSSLPFIIVLGSFFIGIFSTINRAFLQGLLRFSYISLSGILEVVLKLVVAVGLVIWGFKVNGALFGILIAGIFIYFFTLSPLRFLFKTNQQKLRLKGKEMFNFALPVFFSTLAFTSLYTTDVILVRHFLPGVTSGLYAALSTLGKIIFFISGPIIAVMFPLISERHANGGNYKNLLIASGGLVGMVCLLITGLYFLLPSFVVRTFFGRAFLTAVPYLGLFGIFLSLYTFSFLLVNFYLSIKKTNIVIFPVMAAVFQIILIWFFHQNFQQVIWISIAVMALLLVSLLGFLLKYKPRVKDYLLKSEKA